MYRVNAAIVLVFFMSVSSLTSFAETAPVVFPKGAPLEISFEVAEQGGTVGFSQALTVRLNNNSGLSSKCVVSLIPFAYATVAALSSSANFQISKKAFNINPLSLGETKREIMINFLADGEYMLFGRATIREKMEASTQYCFIVRDGKLYSGKTFEYCEAAFVKKVLSGQTGRSVSDDDAEFVKLLQERIEQRKSAK